MSRNTDERLTTDDVFLMTNNGLDIWRREIPNLSLVYNNRSPFRRDSVPSFRVKQSRDTGIWVGYDHSTGELYTPITLIQKLYGLTPGQALGKIVKDMGLSTSNKKYNKKFTQQSIIIPPPEQIYYEFMEMKFEKRHHEYWNKGELYEDFLRNNNVFAASKIAKDKQVINIPDDECCFVYVPEDLPVGNLKILRVGPNVSRMNKWRNSIPGDYLWDYYQYEGKVVDKLFVVKSRKDQLVMKLLGVDTISTQSENAAMLRGSMSRIQTISLEQVLVYGSDPQGVRECKKVQEEFGCKYYNTPKALLPEVNDPFGYVAAKSLRHLERHLISKKLI